MPSRAIITVTGHVGREPETRYTQTGAVTTRTVIPVNDGRPGREGAWEDHTTWYNVTAFGRSAETLSKAEKGMVVQVTGRLSTREYTKRDGGQGFAAELVADQVLLVGRIQKEEGAGEERPAQATPARQAVAVEELDDLPF